MYMLRNSRSLELLFFFFLKKKKLCSSALYMRKKLTKNLARNEVEMREK